MIFFIYNVVNIMRERERKIIVELVGCQYSKDDMLSPEPLTFIV